MLAVSRINGDVVQAHSLTLQHYESLSSQQPIQVGLYSVSQKIPPGDFWHFFPNSWEFLVQILHAY